MKSPCAKICVMDAENRYCLGCKRTLGEIARWSGMTDEERAEVMASLGERKSKEPTPSSAG